MSNYYKEVEEARERWADDPIEIMAALKQTILELSNLLAEKDKIIKELSQIRTDIKAEPTKHARPIVYYHGENTFSYECGVCRMPIDGKDYYCRWCGAKMENNNE